MTEHTTRVISSEEESGRSGGQDPPDTSYIGEPDEPGTRHILEDEIATFRIMEGPLREEGQPLGMLDPGVILCGNCQVIRTLHPHETQHAGLYLCQAPEGRVVIKVAALQYPPSPDLWRRLVYLNHPNVLKCYRAFEVDGRYYEVQEFCPGGTLEERVPRPGSGFPPVSADWIMHVLAPQVHAGLQFLHAQEVIHRDIKPANIYVKREQPDELVLGDFDISSVLEITRTSRDTKRAAGTWVYTAPEAFPRFIDDYAGNKRGRVSRSSDYYSLGISIIELLLGTTSLHQCQLPDLFDFYLQGGQVEIPTGIPGRLTLLLQGLLIRNRRIRWGAAEVERWLAGKTSDRDLRLIQEDKHYALAGANRPFHLNAQTAVDLPSLAEAMHREPELAKEDLITSELLLTWVGNIDETVGRELKRDRDSYYSEPDMVVHRAIYHCDPTRPYIFPDGSEVYNTHEWITRAIRLACGADATPESFCTPALFHQLEAWLRLKEEAEPSQADAVAEIRQTPPRVQLEELAYLFQPERPYVIMRGLVAYTPAEIAHHSYGKPDDWQEKRPLCYEVSYQRWIDGALTAWLRRRGLAQLAQQCERIRESLGEERLAAFETILRLLDPALPPVEVTLQMVDDLPVYAASYDRQRSWTLRYGTQGCGVPFGAIFVENAAPGVRLENHLLRQREGEMRITVDPRQDLTVSTVYQALIVVDSGFTRIVNAPFKFTYTVIFPREITVRRVLIGALIGSGILGIPRLVLGFLGEYRPVSLYNRSLDTLWTDITSGNFPLISFLIALLVLGACLYAGLRIWFAALRKSET